MQEYEEYTSPHPLKLRSSGRPVVMLAVILHTDDTSGNRSKQWNKFDTWCLKIAGLPNEINQQLQHIYHICSSNKVTFYAFLKLDDSHLYIALFLGRLCENVEADC